MFIETCTCQDRNALEDLQTGHVIHGPVNHNPYSVVLRVVLRNFFLSEYFRHLLNCSRLSRNLFYRVYNAIIYTSVYVVRRERGRDLNRERRNLVPGIEGIIGPKIYHGIKFRAKPEG